MRDNSMKALLNTGHVLKQGPHLAYSLYAFKKKKARPCVGLWQGLCEGDERCDLDAV